MKPNMAKIKIDLPPHCRIKDRGEYKDVYFLPNKKDRPPGWGEDRDKIAIPLGKIPGTEISKIEDKAKEVHEEYLLFKAGVDLKKLNAQKEGTIPDLVIKFRESEYWDVIIDVTRKDYNKYFKRLEAWSQRNHHPHISTMTTKQIAKHLKSYKDTPVIRKRVRLCLSHLYKVAIDEGYVSENLADKVKLARSTKAKRKKILWTEEAMDKFVARCDEIGFHSMGSIALTMIETAQRQGDVLNMVNGRHYKNGKMPFIQSKTGMEVFLPCTDKLRQRFKDYPPKEYMMFIHENTGRPWKSESLAHKARQVLDEIGMEGYILQDLRPSQVTYLFNLNCTANEVASMTGHTLETVTAMMDTHYAETRSKELAEKVVRKINRHRKRRTK